MYIIPLCCAFAIAYRLIKTISFRICYILSKASRDDTYHNKTKRSKHISYSALHVLQGSEYFVSLLVQITLSCYTITYENDHSKTNQTDATCILHKICHALCRTSFRKYHHMFVLTHLYVGKMTAISQTAFLNTFSRMSQLVSIYWVSLQVIPCHHLITLYV